jgi:hypothetical protein
VGWLWIEIFYWGYEEFIMKSMSTIIRSLTLILPLMAATVQASSIYKCKQVNGSVTYTSSACPEDTVTRENLNKLSFYSPSSSGNTSAETLPSPEAQQLELLIKEREQREMVRRQESAARRDAAKGDDRRI